MPKPRTAAQQQQIDEIFAARLKSLRHTRCWSQAALALRAGISTNHVAYLERGVSEPSMYTLRKIAAAFDMSMSEFLEGVN